MTKILTMLLCLALAGAVFFVYTNPAYHNIQTLQQRIAEYDAGLEKARELQELKRSLLARYNTFSGEQLDRLSRLLPDHVDNVRLVLDLDNMSTRYGMAIQNVTISRSDDAGKARAATVIGALSEQTKKYDSLTLQFSTSATYGNFVRFMEDLESSLRIVDLVALSIDSAGSGIVEENGQQVAEPFYNYSITVRTYWLK